MKFNPKDFNIQDVIQARVNLEDEVAHANDPIPPLPKYIPIKVNKDSVGWFNFVKTTLNELRP